MLSARFILNHKISLIFVAALLGISLGGACSDPERPKNTVIPSGDTGLEADSGELDSGDHDVDPSEHDTGIDVDGDTISDTDGLDTDSDVDHDTEVGVDAGPDVGEPNPYPRCGPVVDLGWLMPGKQALTIDFLMLEDHLKTGCSNAKIDSNEAVFSFRLSDEGMMNLTSSSPIVSELRRSPCENDGLALFCKDNGLSDKVAGAGVWFLVLEQLKDSSADVVNVELELIPTPVCDDTGVSQCVDGSTVEICDITATSPDISRLTIGTCAKGCADGRCLGDSCEAPIVVTDRVDVQGDGVVYNDTHDSRAGAGCHEEANDYNEPELVFELPNLVAGNKVVVATVGDVVPHNILFKSSCEETSACLGYFEETSPVSWDVPADGTYYVIVENGGWAPGEFQINIEIKQN